MSDQPSLSQLDALTRFADRHIGPGEEEQRAMLEALGFPSLDALMEAAVPHGIRTPAGLDLPTCACS